MDPIPSGPPSFDIPSSQEAPSFSSPSFSNSSFASPSFSTPAFPDPSFDDWLAPGGGIDLSLDPASDVLSGDWGPGFLMEESGASCSVMGFGRELGVFAEHAYGTRPASFLPGGSSAGALSGGAQWHETILGDDGFAANIYDAPIQGRDQIVVAFRGTEDLTDWVQNGASGYGVPSQYRQADDLLSRVRASYPEREVVVTGHSLGGGLAGYAASRHDVAGAGFNAAGPSGPQRDAFDTSGRPAHFVGISAEGDVLTRNPVLDPALHAIDKASMHWILTGTGDVHAQHPWSDHTWTISSPRSAWSVEGHDMGHLNERMVEDRHWQQGSTYVPSAAEYRERVREGFTNAFDADDLRERYDAHIDRIAHPDGFFDPLAGFWGVAHTSAEAVGDVGRALQSFGPWLGESMEARGRRHGEGMEMFTHVVGEVAEGFIEFSGTVAGELVEGFGDAVDAGFDAMESGGAGIRDMASGRFRDGLGHFGTSASRAHDAAWDIGGGVSDAMWGGAWEIGEGVMETLWGVGEGTLELLGVRDDDPIAIGPDARRGW